MNIREGTLNGIYKEKASSGVRCSAAGMGNVGKTDGKTLPGYGEQNEALHWMVRILTGVRVLYCLFYLIMTFVYGMEKTNAVMTLLGPFIFYGWYMLMLRESPVLTVLMLIGRGASIVWGGVSLLQMSWWLPFPLVFMLVTAAAIDL